MVNLSMQSLTSRHPQNCTDDYPSVGMDIFIRCFFSNGNTVAEIYPPDLPMVLKLKRGASIEIESGPAPKAPSQSSQKLCL